ncbi:hypothetical protein Bca52824_076587 [Brassica carinata]|uniref:Uncharacterized protein n=1 Tax=Brassica carinata TaxID=52824 RepID=A0A8X7PU93_BRACI|nr:hypothetical protein Bca52824_076587 [Brassica carinata]
MNSLVLSLAPKFVNLQTFILRQDKPELEDNAVEAIENHCHELQELDLSKLMAVQISGPWTCVVVFSSQDDLNIFSLSTTHPPSISRELRITDGESVNFNGHFPSPSPALISLLHDENSIQLGDSSLSTSSTSRHFQLPATIPIPNPNQNDVIPSWKLPTGNHRSVINSFKEKPSLRVDARVENRVNPEAQAEWDHRLGTGLAESKVY